MQKKIFLIAYFFISIVCYAQQYPFVQYTPTDGLVNSRVRNVKQDSKGRMYFITFSGLSVYDGARFINYRVQDGLANELINDIAEAGPDSILVATNTGKLNTLVKGRISEYKTADNFCPLINRFLKSSDGTWYVTAEDGLYKFSGRRFTRLAFQDALKNDIGMNLDRIVEWRNFFLISPWSSEQKQKLILYDRIQQRVAAIYTAGSVSSITTDKNGNVWVSKPDGIYQLDTAGLRGGIFKFNEDIPAVFRNKKNIMLFADSQNNFWLLGSNHIERINAQLESEVILSRQDIKSGILLGLLEDKEGIIWIASDGNGVLKFRGTQVQFLNKIGDHPISATDIQTVQDTAWLFNTPDSSVYRIVKDDLKIFRPGKQRIHDAFITLSGKKLYLSYNREILEIADRNDPAAYNNPVSVLSPERSYLMGAGGITDNHGAIFQTVRVNDSSHFLLVLLDGKEVSKTRVPYGADQMVVDHSGKLWLATRINNLIAYTIHPETPGNYLQLYHDYSSQLPRISPRSLAVDTDDNIWVGTRYDGIFRFGIKEKKIISTLHLNTKDGLTDNFIYTLHGDQKGVIWVGTQNGLDKIYLKDGDYIISNISRNNGFFQAVRKIITTTGNTTWVLIGEGAFIKVAPVPLSTIDPPPVLITLLKINDRTFIDTSLRFSYKKNNLFFTVAAPSFIDEKSIRYSYLLTGSNNKQWSEPSMNAELNFLNLATGKYSLQVKAEFPGEMYPPQYGHFSFTILPPWWQTWWFRILAVCLFIGIIVISIRFYYSRKLEKQKAWLERKQAIEKERTRIATDMHDDLGAGLSRIKFLSETIGMKKQQQMPVEDEISSIRDYSHEMIGKMGEIVWALNEKNDSLSDLLSYTRAYAVEYLSQNGIACEVIIPENIPEHYVSGEFRRNIYLSVKEALHNIVKHAQANTVMIKMETGNRISITIHDDGIGFTGNNKPFRNGLMNMQQRMKDIQGTFEIKNTNGTTIQLSAPVND